jgi:hypothetical protein
MAAAMRVLRSLGPLLVIALVYEILFGAAARRARLMAGDNSHRVVREWVKLVHTHAHQNANFRFQIREREASEEGSHDKQKSPVYVRKY